MTTPPEAPARVRPSSPDTTPEALKAVAAGDAPDFLAFEGLSVTDADKREVAGLALPYDEDLEREDWLTGATLQRFAAGSAVFRGNATLYFGHDHLTGGLPIGKVAGEETPAGPRAVGHISATAKGDEVYTLLKDGVLDKFSIGFYRVTNHLEEIDGVTVLVHDEIDVFEVSVVPDPAFQSAQVDTVLSRTASAPSPAKETPVVTIDLPDMSTLAKAEDVTALAGAVTTLERRLATFDVTGAGGSSAPTAPGESYGHFLKMVAAGDQSARDFLAYVGGTTDDLGEVMKDSWVGDRFKAIEAQRTILNFFSKSPLPADGMGVEYGIEGTDTTKVEKQVAEGDTLAYGKITFDTDRAPLETFGGWGEMTFQQIQRSPFNVVERFFGSLLRRYAQTTEGAVNTLTMASGVPLAGGVLDMSTTDGWTRFVIRAARVLKDKGYPLEGILVGYDVFEELALMRDPNAVDGDRFLNRATGSINVVGLSGDVFNVPVLPVETGATTDVIRAANSEAIRTYEAGGAPFRLQDADITNLTEAASVYGYMAKALEVPGAIIKPATV